MNFKLALTYALGLFGPTVDANSSMITIDGSSTVFPIMEAVAEEFGKENPSIRVTVGTSGTGGGFKKFCAGETDISNASRPIKSTEMEACKKNGIDFVELPVAYDGITVVVSQKNKDLDCLTTAELKKLWEPNSTITTWNQLRPEFQKSPVKLFGPGADSGTFDYFTEAVNGKEDVIRKDFTPSEDDNVLVKGVFSSTNALGYFGIAYFEANKTKLKAVKIDNGQGCIAPNNETIQTGTYAPLSRPLFIYVSVKSLKKPEVEKFANWSLTKAAPLVNSVGYVALNPSVYTLALGRLKTRTLNSVFTAANKELGQNLEALYKPQK